MVIYSGATILGHITIVRARSSAAIWVTSDVSRASFHGVKVQACLVIKMRRSEESAMSGS